MQLSLSGHATYIDAVSSQLLQTGLNRLDDLVVCVLARLDRILDLCVHSKSSLFPVGLRASPALLFAANIDAGSVDFVVTLTLKDVKSLVVSFRVKDTRVELFTTRGSKGH